jgi:Bacteriophage head to tail connecting protein
MKPEQIIEIVDKLKAARGTTEQHWQECADYGCPSKSDIITKSTPGTKKGITLYDATPEQSSELLAGALHGMMTNPTTYWFDLTTGDPDLDARDEVRTYLQESSHTMHTALNNTNFQTEIHEVDLDLTIPGTAGLFILDDDERDFRFSSRHVSELLVQENNKGIIDQVFRTFSWTARQIAQEFGEAILTRELRQRLSENSPDTFEIIHAVYPRDLSGVNEHLRKTPKGYPFASKYILKKEKLEMSDSGYEEWPCAVPRWSKITGEVYGRSPMMKCLPDAKMLNKMMETTIKSAQVTMAPPMQGPDDGFLAPISMSPFAMNYYRAGSQDRIEPIITGAHVDFGFQMLDDVRRRIREAFYVDQLQLQQGPQMTATEVMQRTEEKMRLLGPVLGRQQSELLQPMIDRIFAIMTRKGRLKPAPKILQGRYLPVKYSSLVARAQRVAEGQNIQRFVQSVSPFVQADPTVWDNIDGDYAIRYSADIYGLPEKLLKDQAEVKKAREGRAQAQAEQQQQAQQAQQAQMMGQVAPAMQAMQQGKGQGGM